MRLQLVQDNIELTPDTEKFLQKKFARLDKHLHHFNDDMKYARIRVRKRTRWGYKLNFDMMMPGKKHIYAQAISSQLPDATIKLRSQVSRQLKTFTDKLNAKKPLK